VAAALSDGDLEAVLAQYERGAILVDLHIDLVFEQHYRLLSRSVMCR